MELSDHIIKAFNNGQPEAFSIVYRYFIPMVYEMAYHYTDDEAAAEDVAHDVFVKLFERVKAKEFANSNHIIAYLKLNTRTMCIDLHRAKERSSRHNQVIAKQGMETSKQAMELYQIRLGLLSQVEKEVGRLTPDLQDVYKLVHKQGYSVEHASKLLNLTPMALYKRIARLTTQLRQSFGHDLPLNLVTLSFTLLASLLFLVNSLKSIIWLS